MRYHLVPADQQVCLVAVGPDGVGTTCNPLGVLASTGRIPLVSPGADGAVTYAAVVGDGWQEAVVSDGRRVPVEGNVVVVPDLAPGASVTLVAPDEERVIRAG